jgi:hypothetical protein
MQMSDVFIIFNCAATRLTRRWLRMFPAPLPSHGYGKLPQRNLRQLCRRSIPMQPEP